MSDGAQPAEKQSWLPEPLKTVGAQDMINLGCAQYGFLRKQRTLERFIRSMKWRQKFVVLSQGCVYCYGSEFSKQPQQAFSLSVYDSVERHDDPHMRYSFKVVPEDPTKQAHVFACESEQKRLEWMEYIHELLRVTHGHSEGRSKVSEYAGVENKMKDMTVKTSSFDSRKRASLPPIPSIPQESAGTSNGSIKATRANFNPVPIPTAKKGKKVESEYDLGDDEDDDDGEYIDDPYDDIKDGSQNPASPKSPTSPVSVAQRKLPPVPATHSNSRVALPGMAPGGAPPSGQKKPPLAPRPRNPSQPVVEEQEYYNEMVTPGEYTFKSNDRVKAVEELNALDCGFFLVRESRQSNGRVLTVKTEEGVKEYSIYNMDGKHSLDKKKTFDSIHDLIIHFTEYDLPCRLLKLHRGFKFSPE